MGGVGSALVNWLIDAQAVTPSQIVILTRRSLDTPHQRGATVVTVDVSNQEALLNCSALREMADVAGIFHLAGAWGCNPNCPPSSFIPPTYSCV
jgi:nucleoside-diphosphate-sugar epimerase